MDMLVMLPTAYPPKIAPFSAIAIVRAASLTGCQSGSSAPRSASSTACLVTAKGTRNSITGCAILVLAMTPFPGALTSLRCLYPPRTARHRRARRHRQPGGPRGAA